MAELGVGAYRFSLAWPRIEPLGDGREERAGLDFYDRLVDGLLERGIAPMVTLYHWDLPSALEAKGGWRSRDTAERFAAYAHRSVGRLGDRVKLWITHNEPWCSAYLGHWTGVHAPGLRDPKAAVVAAHHLLLSHGLAYAALKTARPDIAVGVSLNMAPFSPGDDRPEAVLAAQLADGMQNRWFLDPLTGRGYPEDVRAHLASRLDLPDLPDEDLKTIARLDFLGLNYYNPERVTADPEHGYRALPPRPPLTQMGWEVEPDGLWRLLTRVAADHPHLPLYVTENGVAFPDRVEDGGRVRDRARIRYLEDHVDAMRRAMVDGADVRGYFYWSLLDNFEWQLGYGPRFGLVALGPDLERLPKDSFAAYRDLIARAKSSVPA
jgi:beta-glucosidase